MTNDAPETEHLLVTGFDDGVDVGMYASPCTPDLLSRYREPQRHYHTLEHIHACLGELARVSDLDDGERRILEYAIWWHDAVYDPQRPDNEEASAELARHALRERGEEPAVIDEVVRLVRLTQGHAPEAGDRLGGLMTSIDLSILGSAPEAYDRYAAQVREEYAFVPEPLYRSGRAAILRRFLQRPVIYPDAGFADRYERRARSNLSREIAALEG